MQEKSVILVAAPYIEPGLKKYEGKIHSQLKKILSMAGLSYTPYLFNDGRVLLVLPNNTAAFLYASEETLYSALSLE